MDDQSDNLFNPKDYESIQLKINLHNLSTYASIVNGKRDFENKPKRNHKIEDSEILEVKIAEFLDDGLILEVPSKTCAENHNITLEISTENTDPKVSCSAQLKIRAAEKLSETIDRVDSIFVTKDEEKWNELLSLYNRRQIDIQNYFNSIKGFENS